MATAAGALLGDYCMSGAVIDYYNRLYAAQKAPGANKHTRLALIVAERGIKETELQELGANAAMRSTTTRLRRGTGSASTGCSTAT